MHGTYAYAGHFKDIVAYTENGRHITYGGEVVVLTEKEIQEAKPEIIDRAWLLLADTMGIEPPAATQQRQSYAAMSGAASSSSCKGSSSGKGSK